jgi:hypothetical protein
MKDGAQMNTAISDRDTASSEAAPTERVMQSAFVALSEGRNADLVDYFSDRFIFIDHALGLTFSDKPGVLAFFDKSRELFPDTVVHPDAISARGDWAAVEWTLRATQNDSSGGYFHRHIRISLQGISVVRFKGGRISSWSDYYDHLTSRRFSLAAFFSEWVEY